MNKDSLVEVDCRIFLKVEEVEKFKLEGKYEFLEEYEEEERKWIILRLKMSEEVNRRLKDMDVEIEESLVNE